MSVVGGELEGPPWRWPCSKLLSRLGDPALSGRITGWDDGVYSAELVVDGNRSRPGVRHRDLAFVGVHDPLPR